MSDMSSAHKKRKLSEGTAMADSTSKQLKPDHGSFEHLRSNTRKLLHSGAYSDVVVELGNDTYHLHKAIICSMSEWFLKACSVPDKNSKQQKVSLKPESLELKFCKHVLDVLFSPENQAISAPFSVPMDAVGQNIPIYHSVIKKPMDFGTMQTKLNQGQYNNAKAFESDANLVFRNFKKVPPSKDVYDKGKLLQDVFDTTWANKDKWINSQHPSTGLDSSEEDIQEADCRIVTIKDDHPTMFKRMICYLYDMDYIDEPFVHNLPSRQYFVSPLGVNAYMFALGDKYIIPPLRELALSKFKERLKGGWKGRDLATAVKLAYGGNTTSAQDGRLRDVMLGVCEARAEEFFKHGMVVKKMLKVPELHCGIRGWFSKAMHDCPHCHKKFMANLEEQLSRGNDIHCPACGKHCYISVV